ncbi:MAG: class I SAM-dependent methyltransferase [Acidimicrobiales bacterium]
MKPILDECVWQPDRVLFRDLVFLLTQEQDGADCSRTRAFDLFKGKWTLEQYDRFWSHRPDFEAKSIVELGMWDGGSTALWFEFFQPDKLVAMDIMTKGDSEYFCEYVRSRNIESRISTHWGVDQSNAAQVGEIVASEFSRPLDLVIDDASHMYRETQSSFEQLFPRLRPGGLYIIEDWAWSYFEEFQTPGHPWSVTTELSKLVMQLIEANASTQSFARRVREEPHGAETVREVLISDITVYPHFVVIERGDIGPERIEGFTVEDFISRRASLPTRKLLRSKQTFRRRAGRIIRQIRRIRA